MIQPPSTKSLKRELSNFLKPVKKTEVDFNYDDTYYLQWQHCTSHNNPGLLGVLVDEHTARNNLGISNRKSPERNPQREDILIFKQRSIHITFHFTNSSAFSVYTLASHILVVKKKNVFCDYFFK